ncbi:uncharacterized protein LOC144196572 [Stigmatopora nigra]
MCKITMLRELVKQKLNLAVEEVFELFEKTILEYEEANERRHRALLETVLKPRLRLQRAGSKGSENEEIKSEEPPSKKRKARKRTSPTLKKTKDDETAPPQGDHLAPISDIEDFDEDEAEKKDLDTPTLTKPVNAVRYFTCSVCTKFFRTRDFLIAHIRDHTMGKIASPSSATKKEEKPSTSVKTPPPGKVEVHTSAKKEEKSSALCKNPHLEKIGVPLSSKNEVKASGSVQTPPPTGAHVTPTSMLVVSYSDSPSKDPKTTKLKILNALQRLSNNTEHSKEKPSEDNKQVSQLAKFSAILQNDTPTSNPSNKNGKPTEGKEKPPQPGKSDANPENDDLTSDSSDDEAAKSARQDLVLAKDPDTHEKHDVLPKPDTVKTPESGNSAPQANGEGGAEALSEPESLFAPLSHSDMTANSSSDEASNRDGKKQFACSLCRKTFVNQTLLENHMTAHKEGGAYACSFCDKRYFKAGFLKRHMLLHANETKEDGDAKEAKDAEDNEKTKKKKKSKNRDHIKHKCPHCGKEFMHSSLLAGHLLIHAKEMTEQSKAGL